MFVHKVFAVNLKWTFFSRRSIFLDFSDSGAFPESDFSIFSAQLRNAKVHGAKHSPLNAFSTALREVRISNEFVCINVCFWLSGQFLIEFQRKAKQMRLHNSNELPRNAIRLKTSFQNVVNQTTFTQLPKLMIFGVLGFLLSPWGSIWVPSPRSCAKAKTWCEALSSFFSRQAALWAEIRGFTISHVLTHSFEILL